MRKYEGQVCYDCLVYYANGEVENPEENWEPSPSVLDFWYEIDKETGEIHHSDFSWSRCDACGSTLGGYRAHGILIMED